MTTPTKEIQRLDKFLKMYGSGTGTLTRIVGTTSPSTFSVDVAAHVRNYIAEELTEMIIQGDSRVIISSTQIVTAQWPGAQPLPIPETDIRVPRRGDKFVWQGKTRNIESSEPFYLEDVLVKIVMQVRG